MAALFERGRQLGAMRRIDRNELTKQISFGDCPSYSLLRYNVIKLTEARRAQREAGETAAGPVELGRWGDETEDIIPVLQYIYIYIMVFLI